MCVWGGGGGGGWVNVQYLNWWFSGPLASVDKQSSVTLCVCLVSMQSFECVCVCSEYACMSACVCLCVCVCVCAQMCNTSVGSLVGNF